MLILSLILLFLSFILALPFPYKWPLGEMLFSVVHIPVRLAGGFHTVGVTVIVMLFIGLTLLVNSLTKFQGRIAFLALLIVLLAPGFLVSIFQKTFATGIYAVSYSGEESTCHFEMTDDQTLHGKCSLSFKNLNNEDTRFAVKFHESYLFDDDMPIVSLMNQGGPYEVVLKGKEYLRVEFETDIDVSDMESHIDSGEAWDVEIMISANGKSREL